MDRKFKKRMIKRVQTGLLSFALIITQVVPVGLLPATAVAVDAEPTSAVILLEDLGLTSECTLADEAGARWRVQNTNDQEVDFSWQLSGSDSSGSLTAPADGEGVSLPWAPERGANHFYFDTSATGTLIIEWDNGEGTLKTATKGTNPSLCEPDEEIDTTAPTVTVTAPEANEYVGGNTTFKATLQDDSGIDAYEVIVHYLENGRQRVYKTGWIEVSDLTDPSTFELEYDWDTKSNGRGDGLYELRVFARDEAGNEARHHETEDRYFYVDNTDPQIQLSNISDGDVITSATDLVVSLDDQNGSPFDGKLEIQIMNGVKSDTGTFGKGSSVSMNTVDFDPSAESYTFTLSDFGDLDDGLYRVRVRADDKAGNRGRNHRYVYVDNTAPNIFFPSEKAIDGTTVNGEVHTRSHVTNETGLVNRITYLNGDIIREETNTSRNSEIKFDSRDYSDGEYTLRVVATDQVGNTSEATQTFIIDNTAPTITVKDSSVGNVEAKIFNTVDFKLYDLYMIDKVEINGVEKNLSNNKWSYVNGVTAGKMGAVEGENTIVVYDVAGNTTTYNFTIDTTDPVQVTGLQIVLQDGTDVSDGYINADQRDITVVWDSNEDAGYDDNFKEFEYQNRAGIQTLSNNSFSGKLGGTNPEEGTYTYKVRAVDHAGNKGEWVEVSVTLDLSDPEVSISPLQSSLVSSSLTISGMASDALSGLLNNQITLRLYNLGGFLRSYIVDVVEGSWSETINFSDDVSSEYTVKAVAQDNAGNPNEDLVSFKLDNEPPVVRITSHQAGEYVRGTVTLVGEVEDENPMNSHWRIEGPEGFVRTRTNTNGVSVDELVWNTDTSEVKDGEYTIYFEARDKADNKDGSRSNLGDSVAKITLNVDNTAPVVTATSPDNNSFFNTNFNVRWDSEDNDIVRYNYRSCEYTGDDSTVGESCGGFTRSYTGKSHRVTINDRNQNKTFWWQVQAVDKAGNPSDWTEARFFTIDTIAPVIEIESPEDGETYSGTVSIKGTITDANLYEYSYTITDADGTILLEGGAEVDEVEYDLELDISDLANGEYTLEVTAKDKAGNDDTKKVTITVDNPVGDVPPSDGGDEQDSAEETDDTTATPGDEDGGIGGGPGSDSEETPQTVQTPAEQPAQGGATGNEEGSSTGSETSESAPDNDLVPVAFGVGGGLAFNTEGQTGTSTGITSPVPSTEDTIEADTSADDAEESDIEGTDGDDEDGDDEDNGLAANIGEFIGGWFSTWWGWLISLAVLIFLIFLVIRRREEE